MCPKTPSFQSKPPSCAPAAAAAVWTQLGRPGKLHDQHPAPAELREHLRDHLRLHVNAGSGRESRWMAGKGGVPYKPAVLLEKYFILCVILVFLLLLHLSYDLNILQSLKVYSYGLVNIWLMDKTSTAPKSGINKLDPPSKRTYGELCPCEPVMNQINLERTVRCL